MGKVIHGGLTNGSLVLSATNIPRWSCDVSRLLCSWLPECLSRVPWWYRCGYTWWKANLLGGDNGRPDIWMPWSSGHKATEGQRENRLASKLVSNSDTVSIFFYHRHHTSCQKATLIHCLIVNGIKFRIGIFARTLSMLAGLSLIMEACANRVSTVFIVRWEYSCWGLRSSSIKALLNMVPTMSFMTTDGADERGETRHDLKVKLEYLISIPAS